MRTFYQDLRYGIRILRESLGFTTVAVLTLALGIAVNTTVFSWMDWIWLRPLPGSSATSQLVAFESTAHNIVNQSTSFRDYRDYRDNLKLLSGLAASVQSPLAVGEGENTQRLWGELVSGNYFQVLGVRPFLGRFFSRDEQGDQPGQPSVVVLSHGLWKTRFQGDLNVVGKTLRVNQRELTIIGVAPPEFGGITSGLAFALWAPVTMSPQLNSEDPKRLEQRTARGLNMLVGRLAPGATIEQARAEATTLAKRLELENPSTNEGIGATVLPLSESHSGAASILLAPLKILMAMCLVVLLIVCANVANLLLSRSTARQKEFSIRIALGASRGRLVRQVLTETLLMSGLAAAIGIPLALWLGQSLAWLVPRTDLPVRLDPMQLNADVLGFSILICTLSAMVAGIVPALQAVRPDVNENLKEGGRSGMTAAHSHRARALLVVSEVALALVALVGAGLFLRSFHSAGSVYPGFDARNVVVAQFHLDTHGYSAEDRLQFCRRLRERLEAAPGIVAVSYADQIPLGFNTAGPWHRLQIDGYVPAQGESLSINRSLVAPGYFSLTRIPFVEGRDFAETDDKQAPPVMIVNETFARRYLPGGSPIGRVVRALGKVPITVVGVVKDSKYFSPAEAPMPYFYMPFRQRYIPGYNIAFYIRSAGDSTTAMDTLRREAVALNPAAAPSNAMPLPEYNGASTFGLKVAASILTALGVLALMLAAVGLYSVMAFAVGQRTHEIGIRMAMGARPRDVFDMVVRKGMLLALAGLAAGSLAALALSRVVAHMLFSVSANDPGVFGGAALFLGLVALVANYLPARHATKVDPIIALRCQ